MVRRGVKRDDGKHFVADTKEQIAFPLHIFAHMRQRQAILANRFSVHWLVNHLKLFV